MAAPQVVAPPSVPAAAPRVRTPLEKRTLRLRLLVVGGVAVLGAGVVLFLGANETIPTNPKPPAPADAAP